MSTPPLHVIRACDLQAQSPEQRWLIRDIWARGAAGIVCGGPKLGKSWLALDLALSVASATPCLGRFQVDHPGPVLVYFAEDPLPVVRGRIDALCQHRGIDIAALDLQAIDTPSLHLDSDDDRQRLREAIERVSPHLVVLDPLIRLHLSIDENSAADVSRLLGYLTELQRQYDCAIILVHHAGKKYRSSPGLALRGSSDLHAWGGCNAYLSRQKGQLLLTLEHRASRPLDPLTIQLVSRPDGTATHLELCNATEGDEPATLEDRIADRLRNSSEPMQRKQLREALRINNQKLGQALIDLERRNLVERTPRGWQSCVNHSQMQLCE